MRFFKKFLASYETYFLKPKFHRILKKDKLIDDGKEICRIFNEYFDNIFKS